jgi:hypothetical protein
LPEHGQQRFESGEITVTVATYFFVTPRLPRDLLFSHRNKTHDTHTKKKTQNTHTSSVAARARAAATGIRGDHGNGRDLLCHTHEMCRWARYFPHILKSLVYSDFIQETILGH